MAEITHLESGANAGKLVDPLPLLHLLSPAVPPRFSLVSKPVTTLGASLGHTPLCRGPRMFPVSSTVLSGPFLPRGTQVGPGPKAQAALTWEHRTGGGPGHGSVRTPTLTHGQGLVPSSLA